MPTSSHLFSKGVSKMKGVAEALTAVVMTGVLIGVVSSVYFWGLPLIQKNKDISTLQSSERFMNSLASTIKEVANVPGRQKLTISVPGLVNFDGAKFQLTVNTDGTIYSTEGAIPLGRNECSPNTGTWGVQDYATLCVTSSKAGDKFESIYTLKFIQLDTEGIDSFKIAFSGRRNVGGENRIITIENAGTATQNVGSRKILTSTIAVDIGV